MDSLKYQKILAEYDEKISYYELKMKEIEHEKSRFVKEVLDATIKEKAKRDTTIPGEPTVPGAPTVIGNEK